MINHSDGLSSEIHPCGNQSYILQYFMLLCGRKETMFLIGTAEAKLELSWVILSRAGLNSFSQNSAGATVSWLKTTSLGAISTIVMVSCLLKMNGQILNFEEQGYQLSLVIKVWAPGLYRLWNKVPHRAHPEDGYVCHSNRGRTCMALQLLLNSGSFYQQAWTMTVLTQQIQECHP